jgi:N-carbamoylputrescine amidase
MVGGQVIFRRQPTEERKNIMIINMTVCELQDRPDDFAHDWEGLVAHVKHTSSQLVVLPEMPFFPWFAVSRRYSSRIWVEAVKAHDRWMARLQELEPAVVIGSRPVNTGEKRLNEGFIWDPVGGYRGVHNKYYLPNDPGFWEATWYQRGKGDFDLAHSGELRLGFLICTELWFMDRARAYGRAGAHVIVTPRATGKPTVDKWLVGGRAVAVVSGAYSLSSNRFSDEIDLGGQGWIVGPDGEVLGLTSRMQPFVTVSVDLGKAEIAKKTYPRYVLE